MSKSKNCLVLNKLQKGGCTKKILKEEVTNTKQTQGRGMPKTKIWKENVVNKLKEGDVP